MSEIAQAIANRQIEIDRLQVEIKALTDVERILGASAPAARSTVRTLLEGTSHVHHVFPRNYLKKSGLARSRYNQIANYVVMQGEINIAIGMTRLRRISGRYGVNARMARPDTAASRMPTSCAGIWWLTAYLTAWKGPKSATTADS